MNLKTIKTFNELSDSVPTFCDTEGGGLYIDIRLIQCYQPEYLEDVFLGDTDLVYLEVLKESIKPLHTVWWNAPYDCGALNMTTAKIDDLQKAVKIAYPEFQEYALDKVAKKMGLSHFYDSLNKKELQKARFYPGAYLSHEQKQYAAADVLVLAEIWKDKKVQEVIKNNLAYRVDILSLQYCVEYQQNGIPVHKENITKQIAETKLIVDKHQNEIDLYIREQYDLEYNNPSGITYKIGWKGKLFNTTLTRFEIFDLLFKEGKFKVNSWQKTRLLFQSTESDAPFLLRSAGDGIEVATSILFCRRASKQLSYMEGVNKFDKMYTKFSPGGAATGRFTAKGGDLLDGFNSQQIPRNLKHIFGIPEDGDNILIGADYSTLELRLAASIYKEESMYKKLMDNRDLHAETAKDMIGHENFTKEDRQNAKPVNFGYTFGMGVGTFIEMAFNDYGLIISESEAKKFKQKFFEANPNIAKYHNDIWNKMKTNGYIYSTALGRKTMPKLGTDAINGPVQGTGSEVTKLAVHYMVKEDPECLKYIINVVHDSITMCAPKVHKEYWAALLKRNMVKGWTEISKCSIMHYKDIPMPVEVGFGYEYGAAS